MKYYTVTMERYSSADSPEDAKEKFFQWLMRTPKSVLLEELNVIQDPYPTGGMEG